jgi:hypothetical protein
VEVVLLVSSLKLVLVTVVLVLQEPTQVQVLPLVLNVLQVNLLDLLELLSVPNVLLELIQVLVLRNV